MRALRHDAASLCGPCDRLQHRTHIGRSRAADHHVRHDSDECPDSGHKAQCRSVLRTCGACCAEYVGACDRRGLRDCGGTVWQARRHTLRADPVTRDTSALSSTQGIHAGGAAGAVVDDRSVRVRRVRGLRETRRSGTDHTGPRGLRTDCPHHRAGLGGWRAGPRVDMEPIGSHRSCHGAVPDCVGWSPRSHRDRMRGMQVGDHSATSRWPLPTLRFGTA